MTPTRQEMFNRAYIGLRKQGFKLAIQKSRCVYSMGNGRRCAWGHVDTSLGPHHYGDLLALSNAGVWGGLAAKLSTEDLQWAKELQLCHDGAARRLNGDEDKEEEETYATEKLSNNLHEFAIKYSLTIPA